MQYLGVELVNIPSGMGGVLPAAVASRNDDGSCQVICLHQEYFPNWLLTVKPEGISPFTYPLTDFAKKCIRERISRRA